MSEAQMKNTKVRTAVRGREGAGILPGIAACLAIAVPSWILGKLVPVVGGAVFAILIGMVLSLFWQERGSFEKGMSSCRPGGSPFRSSSARSPPR